MHRFRSKKNSLPRESRDPWPSYSYPSRAPGHTVDTRQWTPRRQNQRTRLPPAPSGETAMACYAALLHPPLASSLSPCSSSRRAGATRAPPSLQRVAAPSSLASARALARVRISPRCAASAGAPGETPAAALRRVLETPGAHQAPACYDALSARLVERAGFRACFTSGTCSLFRLCGSRRTTSRFCSPRKTAYLSRLTSPVGARLTSISLRL